LSYPLNNYYQGQLASEQFKLRVPRAFVGKITLEIHLIPIATSFTSSFELEEHPEFVTDP
jgi:L-lysine 2,3-aminomutase